jgi:UDP-glucose 4-epimerase
MRILVTGASGFLGRHLIPALGRRHEIVATTRAGISSKESGIRWINADLARMDDDWQFPSHVDAVLYMAQSRRYREFPEGGADMFGVNVHSLWRFVDYARRVGAGQFVFASSANVYGPSPLPLNEEAAIDPTTFYATSKRIAEMILESYGAELPTTILRLFTLYGPGQEDSLVADLIDRVKNGRPVTLSGGCGPKFSPLYVTDACEAIKRVIERPPESAGARHYNVGGTEEVSIRDFAEAIALSCGIDPMFEHREIEGEAGWVVDGRRFAAATGWAPETMLKDGLAHTVSARRRSPVSDDVDGDGV